MRFSNRFKEISLYPIHYRLAIKTSPHIAVKMWWHIFITLYLCIYGTCYEGFKFSDFKKIYIREYITLLLKDTKIFSAILKLIISLFIFNSVRNKMMSWILKKCLNSRLGKKITTNLRSHWKSRWNWVKWYKYRRSAVLTRNI